MKKQEKEKYFSNILEILQTVKNGIVADCTEELMYTGTMPVNAQKELKVLANITGCVFSGLQMLGTSLTQDPNHEGLVLVTIDGKTYSCAKLNLDEATTYEKTETPLTVSEAYSVTQPIINKEETPTNMVDQEEEIVSEEIVSEEIVEEIQEEVVVNTETSVETIESFEEEVFEEKIEETVDEFERELDEYENKETVETTSDYSYIGSMSEDEFDEEETSEVSETIEEIKEEKEESVYIPKANVIGETTITPSNIAKDDFFLEENSKNCDEFVYSISKITVLHPEIGSKPEEMVVMIAPLKITKYSCTSVPILVTILNRGKTVTRSSYDILETGKNLVQIDINEFYFLCRGAFDDNGKFIPTIVTTGISANQGDKINIISHKVYGDTTNRETRNGHIKFRYEAECGPGTIEVFPFGQPGETDFVAVVKNKEFIDYYFISKSLRSSSKPIIYTGNGNKQELVCQWDSYDNLVAELVER